MCSINHDKKAMFFHIPKTAGIYIRTSLQKYYDFDLYLLNRNDHIEFCNTNPKYNDNNKLSFCCNKGVVNYYKSSKYLNEIMEMDDEKWNEYFKFCVVRNPYEKAISAWNYIMETEMLNIDFDKYLTFKDIVSENEYWHIFLSQYDNMLDENGIMIVNHTIKYENLEEELEKTLLSIGFDKITHNNKKMKNVREHKPYKEYYTQESLDIINGIYEKDFEFFGYKKFTNIDDFLNS